MELDRLRDMEPRVSLAEAYRRKRVKSAERKKGGRRALGDIGNSPGRLARRGGAKKAAAAEAPRAAASPAETEASEASAFPPYTRCWDPQYGCHYYYHDGSKTSRRRGAVFFFHDIGPAAFRTVRIPRAIRAPAAATPQPPRDAATRLRAPAGRAATDDGLSTRPRHRRGPSPRNIYVAAAAPLRHVLQTIHVAKTTRVTSPPRRAPFSQAPGPRPPTATGSTSPRSSRRRARRPRNPL